MSVRRSTKSATPKALKMVTSSKGAGAKRVRKVKEQLADALAVEDEAAAFRASETAPETHDGHGDTTENGEHEDAVEVEAYKTITVANSKLVIGGLPPQSSAYAWALDIFRKFKRPIVILDDASGAVLITVDSEHLKSVKAPRASSGPRKPAAPKSHLIEAVELARRPQGVTRGELAHLTPGHSQPWTQILKRLAGQQGVALTVVDLGKESGRGGWVAYHITNN